MTRRPHLAHAARVAVVATLIIAVVFVAAAAALDTFLSRRVLWEVDQRLNERLVDVSHSADPRATGSVPDDQGTDGAPIFLWWVPRSGPSRALTADTPPLPAAATAGPVSAVRRRAHLPGGGVPARRWVAGGRPGPGRVVAHRGRAASWGS